MPEVPLHTARDQDGGILFTYRIGGYETFEGEHFNVEAGDPPLEPDDDGGFDVYYIQVQFDPDVNSGNLWITMYGPFTGWDDIEWHIQDWRENGSP